MRRLPDRSRGFTLLELLVAVAILALVAVSAYRLLASTVTTRDQGLRHEKMLRDLQKAEITLQRDLLQVLARPIRDEFGDVQPAFYLPQENAMEFTRRGWRNPLQEARSDMVRVRYRVESGQLLRERWNVLDRARMSTPEQIVLLDDVEDFQVRVFADGKEETAWPVLAQSQKDKGALPLPQAVEVRFTLKDVGDIRRLVLLPENDGNITEPADEGS